MTIWSFHILDGCCCTEVDVKGYDVLVHGPGATLEANVPLESTMGICCMDKSLDYFI